MAFVAVMVLAMYLAVSWGLSMVGAFFTGAAGASVLKNIRPDGWSDRGWAAAKTAGVLLAPVALPVLLALELFPGRISREEEDDVRVEE